MLDVVIVGGGVSGLVAAYDLYKFKSIAVLEAKPVPGGKARTDLEGVDLGGAYIGPTQSKLLQLLSELGIESYDLESPGMGYYGKSSSALNPDGSCVPSHNLFVFLDVNHVFRTINRLSKTVDKENPRNTPNARSLDTTSAYAFIHSLCLTNRGAAYVTMQFHALFTTDLTEVSALTLLWFTACAGSMKALLVGESAK
eukprot:PhF_6_TR36031/c0_g1_i2/m.52234/K00274/MAO, aofH; monoamine oxidase